MLGLSLALIFLLLGFTKKAGGYTQQASEPLINDPAPRLAAIAAPVVLPTQPPATPKPKPKVAKYVPARANCVTTLKKAGVLPCQDCSPTDLAKDIPTNRADLEIGERGVIVTSEGVGTGHVLYAERLPDGSYKSLVEGNHPVGKGRIVDPDVLIGVAAAGKTEPAPTPKPTQVPPKSTPKSATIEE